jgi:hypothetical protein
MKTFFKSTSGTYYYDEFPINYPAGYTVVSKDEYNAWCVQMGLLDLVVE